MSPEQKASLYGEPTPERMAIIDAVSKAMEDAEKSRREEKRFKPESHFQGAVSQTVIRGVGVETIIE